MRVIRRAIALIIFNIIAYLVYNKMTTNNIILKTTRNKRMIEPENGGIVLAGKSIAKHDDRQINENLALEEWFRNKTSNYVISHNMTQYLPIERQNVQQKKKSKSSIKPDSNYRLNRLLFQLWDPQTNENEHNMFTCKHLVSENRKTYRQAKQFARKLNAKFYEYARVREISDAIGPTCNNIRKLFRHQTPNFGPASYSIAYTITLERTAEQSLRMLLSIYHHDNVYCLHPNAKYGMRYFNIFRKVSECIPNIFIPEKIFEIRVKTHNRLKAEAECFKKLMNVPVPWKYGINLPSTVFPLYNHSRIVQYLRSKPYETEINWKIPDDAHFMSRVQYTHVIKSVEGGDRAMVKTNKRKHSPPDRIKIYRKGSSFIGTREFYQFLVNSTLAKDFLKWARDTKNPEDFYYSSLYKHVSRPLIESTNKNNPEQPISSIPYSKVRPEHEVEDVSVEPDSSLLISLWGSDRGNRCHGKYRGSFCIFGSADLKWLLHQSYLFANSFDFRVDRFVVDCLSKNLKEPILKGL